MTTAPKGLRETDLAGRFCDAFHCTPEEFRRKVFWQCLHRRAIPFAGLILLLHPSFFKLDFNLIEELKDVRDRSELQSLISSFRDHCRINRHFLHERLRIRLSGKRLIALFDQLF